MKKFLLLVVLPLSAQIHVSSCSPGDTLYTPVPSLNCPTGNCCYASTIPLPAGAPAYFKNERFGNFTYNFVVANGTYNVVLHFIENSTAISGVGQRVFNVSINGAPVLTNFDLAAIAPLNTPVDRSFPAAAAGGSIAVAFTTVTRNAVVSAMDVVPANQFPGCASNGSGGIACAGALTSGVGMTYASTITFGGVNYILPVGDGTGKVIQDAGVAPCDNVDPQVLKSSSVCHVFTWLALPVVAPTVAAGIRSVTMADGALYWLVDQTGNK